MNSLQLYESIVERYRERPLMRLLLLHRAKGIVVTLGVFVLASLLLAKDPFALLAPLPILTGLAIYFSNAFVYVYNQFTDIEEDTLAIESGLNKAQFIGLQMGKGSMVLHSASTLLLGLLLAWLASFEVFLGILVLSLVGLAYSAPFPRLKSIPVADLVACGLIYGATPVYLAHLVFGGSLSSLWAVALVSVPVFMMTSLLNQVLDIDIDRKVGNKTFASAVGAKNAVRVCIALTVLAGAGVLLLGLQYVVVWLLLPAIGLMLRELFRLLKTRDSKIVKEVYFSISAHFLFAGAVVTALAALAGYLGYL